MEKRTIGGFIAALRRASGMTQRELAERLNVSDKTVNRWERDDSAPDLALIPVIAEIFGVSCDELLRGERRSPEERTGLAEEPEPTARGEKQRQRLLTAALSRLRTRSYVSVGLAVGGLIAAMVGNFGFLRAYLGFLAGAVLWLAAAVCQAVWINSALLSVSEDSLDRAAVGRFKWAVARQSEGVFTLIAVLLAFSLPLVRLPGDTYVGLRAGSWFVRGALCALIAALLAGAVCWSVNGSLLRRGKCVLREDEEQTWPHNHALRKSCTVTLVGVLAATLLLHALGGETIWSASALARGTVFNDYESFVAFMEQDMPDEEANRQNGWFIASEESAAAPESATEIVGGGDITWYDAEGNVITEEEARTRTLKDSSGQVVCTYIDRNLSVSHISYSPREGTVLPIRVVTDADYRAGRSLSQLVSAVYCLLYPAEVLAAGAVYWKKRAK